MFEVTLVVAAVPADTDDNSQTGAIILFASAQ
jgi:hypothetical protein